jgi:hypothetical protein
LKSSDIATLFQLSDGTTDVAANNDPVGYWADQSGNGNHLIQATAGSRPLYQTAGPGVLFDGSDDRLALASRLTATSGSFVARFTTGASQFEYPAAQVLLSCADTATATSWFEIGVDLYGRVYIEYNNAGTKHTVIGSTRLELSTSYSLIVVHNGEDFYVLLNGRAENPLIVTNVGTYAWFGDVASADNTVIGGTITSAGLVRPWRGSISEILITSKDITA